MTFEYKFLFFRAENVAGKQIAVQWNSSETSPEILGSINNRHFLFLTNEASAQENIIFVFIEVLECGFQSEVRRYEGDSGVVILPVKQDVSFKLYHL